MIEGYYHRMGAVIALFLSASACSDEPLPESDATEVVTRSEVIDCPYSEQSVAQIDSEKSLIIRDLRVVEDACRTNLEPAIPCAAGSVGVWTFWHLMDELAGDRSTSDFVLEWLHSFATPGIIVNGFELRERTLVVDRVINPWRIASGCQLDGPCELEPTEAPFRLLAIVNRMDLFSGFAHDGEEVCGLYGCVASGSLGEGRFVFGVLDGRDQPLDATVILEFAQMPDARAQEDAAFRSMLFGEEEGQRFLVRDTASDWRRLSTNYAAFDESYMRALQQLTDNFARRENLNQIRTNEKDFLDRFSVPFFDDVWSLREFELDPDANALVNRPVAQTPDTRHNDYMFARREFEPNGGMWGLFIIPFLQQMNALAHRPVDRNGQITLELLDDSPLNVFISNNRADILANRHVVPAEIGGQPFLAGEGTSGGRLAQNENVWLFSYWEGQPSVDPNNFDQTMSDTRRVFAFNTCGGCHYRETHTTNFHVRPRPSGRRSELSDFLQDRDDPLVVPEPDELGRRFSAEYDEPLRRKCELVHFSNGNLAPLSGGTGRVH